MGDKMVAQMALAEERMNTQYASLAKWLKAKGDKTEEVFERFREVADSLMVWFKTRKEFATAMIGVKARQEKAEEKAAEPPPPEGSA